MLQTNPGATRSPLQESSLLVHVEIRMWSGYRMDKKASDELEQRTGAARRAGRVNKTLLPGCKELDEIKKQAAKVRALIDQWSLPWCGRGQRIMRAEGFMELAPILRREIDSFKTKVNEFYSVYDGAVRQVSEKSTLGTLFDPADYPDIEEMKAKRVFYIKPHFAPVPNVNDWRLDIDAGVCEQLREEGRAAERELLSEAMGEAYNRIGKVLSHASEKLNDEKAVFRNSLVENAEELCDALSALNIAQDPKLDQIGRDIRKALCSHNPDTLRKDAGVRADAAKQVDDILARMGYSGV